MMESVVQCSDHYASLIWQKDELTQQKSECQRHLHEAMQSAYDSNTKVGCVNLLCSHTLAS